MFGTRLSRQQLRLAFESLGRRTGLWVAFWAGVWVVQWVLAPTWLVGSRAGLAALMQALPAAVVALLALVLASLFVLASHTVSLYGSRSVLIVLLDPGVVELLLRPLVVAMLALLIAGQVPDSGRPASWVTAAVATLVLTTAWLLYRSVGGLVLTFTSITAPKNFALRVATDAIRFLRGGASDLVVYRVPLLGEMIRAALRRGESVAVRAALEALLDIQSAYLRVAVDNPRIRFQSSDDGVSERTWLGEELYYVFVRAADEALKLGAAEDDMDAVAWAFERTAVAAIRAGLADEGSRLCDGLTRAGVTSHQVSSSAVNI